MNKFIMSYSCGKDSTLALYRMINKGNIPVALITTINKYKKKSCFHGVSVNLKVIRYSCSINRSCRK